MIIDNLSNIKFIPDYILIGSGPASISCALSLEKKNKTCLILEAGEIEFTEESQKNYQGTVIGDPYHDLDIARLRFFGGSSNHWGGWCRPLDSYDFDSWLINYEEINKYRNEACKILEIENQFDNENFINDSFKQVNFEFSDPPVRFGEKYKNHIFKSKNINIAFNAYVLKLSGTNKVEKIHVLHKNNYIEIIPKITIVGCGGIENSRLLLWSRYDSNNNFLKNLPIGHDWMEHPHLPIGDFIGEEQKVKNFKNKYLMKNFAYTSDDGYNYGYFISPTKKLMTKMNINNFNLRMGDPIGIKKDSLIEENIRALMCVAPRYAKKLSNLLDKNILCSYKIMGVVEQKPNKDNKIILSASKKDLNGIPLVELHWKKNNDIRDTVSKFCQALGKFFIDNDVGRIALHDYLVDYTKPYPKDSLFGLHHMGGTIMGKNAYESVVDQNLKVHEVNNLYIIGSSVFPTAGYANPTLSIVQLSLRLADHLTN